MKPFGFVFVFFIEGGQRGNIYINYSNIRRVESLPGISNATEGQMIMCYPFALSVLISQIGVDRVRIQGVKG